MDSERPGGEALASLKIGERGRVIAFTLAPTNRVRLEEMGLTCGARIEVVRYAPMGDPIDIKVRGYHLSLRRTDAEGIVVSRE